MFGHCSQVSCHKFSQPGKSEGSLNSQEAFCINFLKPSASALCLGAVEMCTSAASFQDRTHCLLETRRVVMCGGE